MINNINRFNELTFNQCFHILRLQSNHQTNGINNLIEIEWMWGFYCATHRPPLHPLRHLLQQQQQKKMGDNYLNPNSSNDDLFIIREHSQKLVGGEGWEIIYYLKNLEDPCTNHFQGPTFSIPKIWDTPNLPLSPHVFLVPVFVYYG